jgi:hypothetical protein
LIIDEDICRGVVVDTSRTDVNGQLGEENKEEGSSI